MRGRLYLEVQLLRSGYDEPRQGMNDTLYGRLVTSLTALSCYESQDEHFGRFIYHHYCTWQKYNWLQQQAIHVRLERCAGR